jgi:hypothetical protein
MRLMFIAAADAGVSTLTGSNSRERHGCRAALRLSQFNDKKEDGNSIRLSLQSIRETQKRILYAACWATCRPYFLLRFMRSGGSDHRTPSRNHTA